MGAGHVGRLVAAAATALAAAVPGSQEATCAAAGEACGGGASPHYYWPQAHGRPEHPGRSPHAGPKNLSASLAWTWNHPEGQYSVVIHSGPLIDDRLNIYLSTTEQIFKFSPEGDTLWTYTGTARLSHHPSIADGALYAALDTGQVLAVSMETGRELWSNKIAESVGTNVASVSAHDGYVLATVAANLYGGSCKVCALRMGDGHKIWDFVTDAGMWNFLPVFTGNGSFVFQDENGNAYHLRLSNGEQLWKVVREGASWTSGGAMLGPNGVVYAVHDEGHLGTLAPRQPSDISAYSLESGELLWRHNFFAPANMWPAVAGLGKDGANTLLFPYGGQATQTPVVQLGPGLPLFVYYGAHSLYLWLKDWGPWVFKNIFQLPMHTEWPGGVAALDPETGTLRWEWKAPTWRRPEVKGDDAGLFGRTEAAYKGHLWGQLVCLPNPWGGATVDADGTIYVGFQDGKIYALRDVDGTGVEVDSYETTAAFPHAGAAIAPGMLAIANCDTLYVFRDTAP